MRILIFNWRDWGHARRGGAEYYVHEVASQWAKLGHEVTLFCAAVDDLPEYDHNAGVKIIRRGSRLGVYKEARKFYERSGKGQFDLVVDVVNTRPFMCPDFVKDTPVAALIFQVAREVWFHEVRFPTALAGRFIFEPYWLRRYRNARVLTISESSRASLAAYGLNDVTVIPVGFSTSDLLSADSDEAPKKETAPTIVFCGRLSSNKRPDHAIKAFELLRQRVPEAQLWVVGTGPQEEALRRSAPPGVSFFGHVSHAEKFEILARAHALVSTSVREGWGLVVTEAAAAGTIAVGYDVAGLRDSVKAADGILVAPRPDALASALADNLEQWCNDGYQRPPSRGGVVEWHEVASSLLAAAVSQHTSSDELYVDLNKEVEEYALIDVRDEASKTT